MPVKLPNSRLTESAESARGIVYPAAAEAAHHEASHSRGAVERAIRDDNLSSQYGRVNSRVGAVLEFPISTLARMKREP
jgi:hypothetical protein